MRRVAHVASHPLTILTVALGLNLYNDRRGGPTMCGTTRRYVPWPWFVAGWAGLTGWLLPHYARPFFKKVQDFTSS